MAKLQPKVYIIGLTNGAACMADLAAASLQAVPREAVVQATDAMRVADLGLARRR